MTTTSQTLLSKGAVLFFFLFKILTILSIKGKNQKMNKVNFEPAQNKKKKLGGKRDAKNSRSFEKLLEVNIVRATETFTKRKLQYLSKNA